MDGIHFIVIVSRDPANIWTWVGHVLCVVSALATALIFRSWNYSWVIRDVFICRMQSIMDSQWVSRTHYGCSFCTLIYRENVWSTDLYVIFTVGHYFVAFRPESLYASSNRLLKLGDVTLDFSSQLVSAVLSQGYELWPERYNGDRVTRILQDILRSSVLSASLQYTSDKCVDKKDAQ